MFGYVLPYREKLDDQQWADYRAVYCGLCHTLKRRYGFLARFLLNYDFTFLALLLSREQQCPETTCKRCPASPVRGRQTCGESAGLDAAADLSVLLVYWKLKDQQTDESGWEQWKARLLLILFHFVFRRGKARNEALDGEIGRRLSALRQLEQQNCPSLDRTADQFATILTAMVPEDWPEAERRTLEQLLYHLGRWIYLIDAWDDLEEDRKRGGYNPVLSRFQLTGKDFAPEELTQVRAQMERTVGHSEHLAISAFYLGSFGYYTPVIENILCAGLQSVRSLVFSGEWKHRKRRKKQELHRL
jgi:hypothetical protein